MQLTASTQTYYAVARDGQLISAGFPEREIAERQLQHVRDTMMSVGLEPDVDLVSVDVRTSVSKPKVIVLEQPGEPAEDNEAENITDPEG